MVFGISGEALKLVLIELNHIVILSFRYLVEIPFALGSKYLLLMFGAVLSFDR